MINELLLLRHGKSDWKTNESDFNRPLKDRGKRGAQRVGVLLAQQGIEPDYIVSSPAQRALVTTEKCIKAMGMGVDIIHTDPRIYEADLSALISVLADCPRDAKRVMLVGHNPGLEMLLMYLLGDSTPVTDDGKLLPTATLARLTVNKAWNDLSTDCANLESITRPRVLPKKFPFPSPSGEELRDRPAYYYSQSSVIPWRMYQGKVEILIISSSKKKHRVVPKGIWEPGLTAEESAAKEALEEAGVEGHVSETMLGSYEYVKWGSTCSVYVYAMEVTHVLDENEWEEVHRGREWVSPEKAAKRLRQEELKPMVMALAGKLQKD